MKSGFFEKISKSRTISSGNIQEIDRTAPPGMELAALFDSTLEISPGPDIRRLAD
jgi:hypothetical protein